MYRRYQQLQPAQRDIGHEALCPISNAVETAVIVYDKILDDVGAAAAERATDILDVWDEVDPHWEVYGKY